MGKLLGKTSLDICHQKHFNLIGAGYSWDAFMPKNLALNILILAQDQSIQPIIIQFTGASL